ncbi:DsbA family protein [Candidatus Uhrbacteria bacterium]|nr:DsbA family protein [Candidatus Uhrbacteria bacterium]
MVCILSFIVLSITGLFSSTHRELAKEAWGCVWRRVTLRPCTVGFKEKIKGRLVAWLLGRSTLAAKILNRYFELLSWTLVVLTMVSTFWTVRGLYNYYFYGSCNGLNSTGFCVFDPAGENNQVSSLNTQCSDKPQKESDVILSPVPVEEFPTKNAGVKNQVVFIGCYSCDYTRKSYPLIQQLIKETGAQYTFVHFPVKPETKYLSAYAQCIADQNIEQFWKWNDVVFASEKSDIAKPEYIQTLMEKNGIDTKKVLECVNDPKTAETVNRQYNQIKSTHLYGTPTIFFNGRAYVGPKPYRVYRNALRRFLPW